MLRIMRVPLRPGERYFAIKNAIKSPYIECIKTLVFMVYLMYEHSK